MAPDNSPLHRLGRIPIAALVGVMLLVCKQTFSWSSLRLIGKIPKVDLFTIALVSTVTVTKDLAQAVFYGVVASALGFAWKQSTRIKATSSVPTGGWKTYAGRRAPLLREDVDVLQSIRPQE